MRLGRKLAGKVEDVPYGRRSKRIDRLRIITNYCQPAAVRCQPAQNVRLERICILVFVHEYELVSLAACLQRVWVFGKKAQGEQDQIIKIHRITCAQGRLVMLPNVFGHGAEAFIGKHIGAFPAISKLAEQSQDCRRISFLSAD